MFLGQLSEHNNTLKEQTGTRISEEHFLKPRLIAKANEHAPKALCTNKVIIEIKERKENN